MHYTVHRVALREPFRNEPRELIATSQSMLISMIRQRVDFLDSEYTKARLPVIINIILYTLLIALDVTLLFLCIATATTPVWIVATIILVLVYTLYQKYVPSGQITLTQAYYCWRCRAIWRTELDRRCAADAQ